MDKARKKVATHIALINKKNEKLITKELDKILGLKRVDVKHIDTRKTLDIYDLRVHEETHHFSLCTRFILDLMSKLQNTHPYTKLSFVRKDVGELLCVQRRIEDTIEHINKLRDRGPRKKKLKTSPAIEQARDDLRILRERKAMLENAYDWSYISIHVYWENYINELQGTASTLEELMAKKDDFSGVQQLLKEINETNKKLVEEKLQIILKRRETSLTQINDEIEVILRKDTFNNYFSRQNFQNFCNEIRRKYSFIEIFHTHDQACVIRVWWKIYFQPHPTIEPEQKNRFSFR